MVDAADNDKIEAARNELHNLLDKPQLTGTPVRTSIISLFYIFIISFIFIYHLLCALHPGDG